MPKNAPKTATKKPRAAKPEKITIVTRAATMAAVLTKELRDAHSRACVENPLLAVILLELIIDTCTIERRLAEMREALKQ